MADFELLHLRKNDMSIFGNLDDDVIRTICGHLTESSSGPVPFLPELALRVDGWLPSWGPGRLSQIMGEDRTHYRSPVLRRFERLRRRIRDHLVLSVREL